MVRKIQLIKEGNAFYELDEACLLEKEERNQRYDRERNETERWTVKKETAAAPK